MPGKTAALIALAALVGLAVYANYGGMGADTQISVLDAKTTMHTANSRDNLETATFAAGCFWGVEQAFRRVKGVVSTSVGYTGGDVEKPTYERVCSGTTGHSEAVHVTFDPEQVTYDELLDVFWGLHDPSRKAGRQYRSAIFFHSPEQEAAATASKAKLEESGKYKGQIATEILPAERFWRAEEYHQQYLEKRKL